MNLFRLEQKASQVRLRHFALCSAWRLFCLETFVRKACEVGVEVVMRLISRFSLHISASMKQLFPKVGRAGAMSIGHFE